MLHLVNAGQKSLADYASLVSRGLMDEVRRLAEPLEGKRVLHLSATAFGGGVAEILYTLVPLMADAGLEVEWRVMRGADEFFRVTKTIHNALQGDPHGLSEEDVAVFHRYNRETASELEADAYDFVIVHDPQPAATIDSYPSRRAHWIWRGPHRLLDAEPSGARSAPALPARATTHRSSICASTCRTRTGCRRRAIWPPAIDPLQPKNMALSSEDAAYIVDQFGIDVDRPLLTQVSRFDPWKDPLGVIDAYRHREAASSRTCSSRSSARWRTTTPRAGSTTSAPSPTRTAIPTSTSWQHEQRRRRRGQRVPGPLARADPEVDPRRASA